MSAPDSPERSTIPATGRRSGFRRALGGALVIAGALLLAAWWLFRAAVHLPAPGRPEVAPAPRRPALTATTVSPPAERGRAGRDWTPLAAGAELGEDEEVRTGPGGGAELSAGERARVTISERTQLSVRELREDLHRYGLARGRVVVDYAGDGERTVRIEGQQGASAQARGARFAVSSDGLAFAVATETGRVDLSAAGASVAVEAGRQAAAADGPPSEAHPIPKDVLLRLSPSGPGNGAHCLEAAGRADPGALVTVDGMPVPVDGAGRFRVRVDRAGGPPVEVVAALPDGRSVSRQVPCARREEARVRDIEVRWRRDP